MFECPETSSRKTKRTFHILHFISEAEVALQAIAANLTARMFINKLNVLTCIFTETISTCLF
jgi:hypothetical protein